MGTSESDLSLTESFEGYARALPNGDCESYFDAIGRVWTIGFGTAGADIRQGLIWTRAQAAARLQSDWLKARQGVLRASPILANYKNRLDAVTDFAYNLGVSRYAGSSMRSYINRQDWNAAANEFPKWNLGGGKVVAGLVRRRAAELVLFQTPDENQIASGSTLQSAKSSTEKSSPLKTSLPLDASTTTQTPPQLPQTPETAMSLFASFAKQLAEIFRRNN